MRDARLPVLTVIVSQGQSRSPDKRQLETSIAEGAAKIAGVDVLVVPHLYDLSRDGESYQQMRAVTSPIVLCAWLFDRAAHWVLDRNGVRGSVGKSELKPLEESDEDEDGGAAASTDEANTDSDLQRVTDAYPRPARPIYCLDLRDRTDASDYLREIARIAEIHNSVISSLTNTEPSDSTLSSSSSSHTDSAITLPSLTAPVVSTSIEKGETLMGLAGIRMVDEHPSRRWYPVIDFSRCTNCMECIDFCLFGVYGIDNVETILVEQPDNCRKGCPACSRVCPQNAIIFPQHKTPAIAGAPMDSSGFKIDLSKLFGAPDEGADAIEVAARERDEQLILAGRQAVGLTEDLAARITKTSEAPRDELDNLIDQLDSLEL